jgi:hypothetical protein
MPGRLLGWVALAALVAYAITVHHGVGPVRPGASLDWWSPRGLFLRYAWLDPLTDGVGTGLPGFLLPAVLLAAFVWLTLRSSVARLIAVWAVLGVGLFTYYGIQAAGVWQFFRWRSSAVMVLVALAVATAIVAPWLAARFERLSWGLRLALYVPLAGIAIAFMRNATGTDPSLQFSLSPWPVVPFFGLELLVPAICFGVACAAGTRALFLRGSSRVIGGLAALAGIALAVLLLYSALRLDVALDWKLPALALCLGFAVYATRATRGESDGTAAAPGRHAALGAVLVALPVLMGLAWVERDYTFTRDQRAREINDALASYLEQTGEYPDELDSLVETGFLRTIPTPRVGFRLLGGQQAFVYQNFGISYLLEFSTPRWVQCAYNPPYADEDELDAEEAAGYEDEDWGEDKTLPGSWSCPSRPPELW